MSITTSVDTSEVRLLFAKIAANTADYRSVWAEAKQYLRSAHAANFSGNGFMVGGWAPLQPETSVWKAKEGYPPFTLVRSGELFRSIAMASGRPNEVSSKSMSFGTDVSYAQFHQYGAPGANLPKRQVVFEPPGFSQFVAERIAAHIKPNDMGMSNLRSLFR